MSTRKISEEHANQSLCTALLKQQEANLELVEALQCRISFLEKQLEAYRSRHSTCLDFFSSRPELIQPYVEFMYAAINDSDVDDCLSRDDVISAVRYFHDTSFDLSTLHCTGKDFPPWQK